MTDRVSSPAGSETVGAMFGGIAKDYDRLNRILSGSLDLLWRRALVASVTPGSTGRVLDLAAGTMDVSLALARRYPGLRVFAMDFCLPMLVHGRPKLEAADEYGRRIRPVTADAFRLPVTSGCMDAVTVAFGLRNMTPRLEALKEMHRVLVPGGTVHVLEFGSAARPVWGGMYNWYLAHILPRIGGLLSGDREAYAYLARTIAAFPSADHLAGEMEEAGFTSLKYRSLSGGIVYLHTGQKNWSAKGLPE